MAGIPQDLSIFEVELDRANPRIRHFLEDYEGDISDDRIGLALDVAGDAAGSSRTGTTADRLKNSILAQGGIIQPILVNRSPDGRLVCVEGNTRLFIYRQFHREGVAGDWSRIPAIVHANLEHDGVDAIRLQAHLVGPRAWDAYSKAKYQYELHFKHMMPLERLVDLCGGDKRDVQKSINAYADMETHYRKFHDAEEFYDIQRYSGFVELQNARVKTAIFNAGFTVDDFAKWIKTEKFTNLQSIRQLPLVLKDSKTRAMFLKKGMKAALASVDQPDIDVHLRTASMSQLARALREKVETLPFMELQRLKENPDDALIGHLGDALDAVRAMLTNLGQLDDVG
ncbi:ParB/Srx family N-terminal domain-containing protein [Mesorhizobium sp. M0092]|uniref:ParB/Srx family N-terminal domain-containing protein n=1 Tax=Mesorhizobium sp. M0092 TaxID=2956876 RepID=UPI0033360453